MTTAIAAADKRVQTFRGLLDAQKKQIALCLPKHMDADKMVRIALTAMQRTPKLLECDPTSILACVMGAAELGLELSGPLGQAYMVPRYNKHLGCQAASLQVGYRGFQQLAYRSGEVVSFPARVVYEKDAFEVNLGTHQFIMHRPYLGEDPGPAVAFYAVLNLQRGSPDFEVMSLAQVEAHRARFAKDNAIWDSDFDEMAKKTVIRRLAKRAPISTDLVRAAMTDEYGEAGVEQGLPAVERSAEMTRLRMEMFKERMEAEPPADGKREGGEPITEAQIAGLNTRFSRLGWAEEQIKVFLEENYAPQHALTLDQADAALKELDGILGNLASEKPAATRSAKK